MKPLRHAALASLLTLAACAAHCGTNGERDRAADFAASASLTDGASAARHGSLPASPPLLLAGQAPAPAALLRTGLSPLAVPPWHPTSDPHRLQQHDAAATLLALQVATRQRLAFCRHHALVRTGACSCHATSLPPPSLA
jgi:hypothetical protein